MHTETNNATRSQYNLFSKLPIVFYLKIQNQRINKQIINKHSINLTYKCMSGNYNRKKIALAGALMFMVTSVSAQTVKGVVTDNTGEPIIGASVMEVGVAGNGGRCSWQWWRDRS